MTKSKDLVFILFIAAVLVGCIALGSGYIGNLVVWMSVAAVMATSLRFVLLIGELNFATAAFFGIGAYCTGYIANYLDLPFFLILALSALLALAVKRGVRLHHAQGEGAVLPADRLCVHRGLADSLHPHRRAGRELGPGGHFPADLARSALPLFRDGIVLRADRGVAVRGALEPGQVFVAIRDNENVVRSLGIPVFMTKVLCFAVASAVAGLAGSVHAYASNVISPLDFGFMLSTFALAYLKVGGEDSRWGPSSGRCCSWGSPAMRRPSEATSTFSTAWPSLCRCCSCPRA